MPVRLSETQIRIYQEQGFLIVEEPLFSPDKFAAFKDRFEWHLKLWENLSGHPVEGIDRANFVDPKLNEWFLSDQVLDLVEPLIGPDIALFATSCLNKLAPAGKRVPWHEDGSYWKPMAENRIEVVTVWLAIDPSTPANGCMRVIAGSHRERDREHEQVKDIGNTLLRRTVREDLVDESKAVDCVLEPNHCSLHDAYLIHGSDATDGKMRRCGYQMRYMPTTVKSTHFSGQMVYLARGRDRAGNEYLDPDKVNDLWLEERPELQRIVEACAA